MMISNIKIKLPMNILENTYLLQVLLHLYYKNEKEIMNNPFKRYFESQNELKKICLKYDENFKEEKFKIWSDEGYLLSNDEIYLI